ncbi:MAG: DUF4922 domain-containing protein [Spirochaetota bacterium]
MDTVHRLTERFLSYNPEMPQEEMQVYLSEVYRREGMRAALERLFEWELAVGYITRGKLEDNKRYGFHDSATGVTFRTQINYARDNYSPAPMTGANVPKLHCPICYENIGLPGKETLRVFRFPLNGREFFMQLTPFPLFKKHFVLISMEKTPMIMDRQSVEDLVAFVDDTPGYTGCSNSEIEWAGASVRVHHHYQIFDALSLPVMEAHTIPEYSLTHRENGASADVALINFPIAVCRVTTQSRESFIDISSRIIDAWKKQVPGKNTCNITVRKFRNAYECHIIFRNPDHRTPSDLVKIKSEGVGIIEVAGEGIYPVPKGDDAAEKWRLIEEEGLTVIKAIIDGNNPVKRSGYGVLFDTIKAGVHA